MTQTEEGPYYELEVSRIIQETPDARSIVLAIPSQLRELFSYSAGQFLTFSVSVAGHALVRCYSLASCPDSEHEHKVTIKRVDGGRVSNWFNDQVSVGQRLHVMKPAGNFCLQPRSTPLVLFAGGSGITPVISIIKSTLTTTDRRIKLVYANRDETSIIFRKELEALMASQPERLELVHRLDQEHGFLDRRAALNLIADAGEADFYVCGPQAYMDVVEEALAGEGVAPERIFIERFVSPELEALDHSSERVAGEETAAISVYLDGKVSRVPVGEGETILEACHRAGLDAPCACVEGYCGACMAMVKSGKVAMRQNDGGIDAEQEREGWVLTCQGLVGSEDVRVDYPDAV